MPVAEGEGLFTIIFATFWMAAKSMLPPRPAPPPPPLPPPHALVPFGEGPEEDGRGNESEGAWPGGARLLGCLLCCAPSVPPICC